MRHELLCIVCPVGCHLSAELLDDGAIAVTGNGCKRGVAFAEAELTHPTRSLTTTVRTAFPDVPVLPVRTDGEIPKELLFDAMRAINAVTVRQPVGIGDIVIENLLDTGCHVIATSDILLDFTS